MTCIATTMVLGARRCLSGRKLIGVVTATDLMSFLASLPGVAAEHAEGDGVADRKVTRRTYVFGRDQDFRDGH